MRRDQTTVNNPDRGAPDGLTVCNVRGSGHHNCWPGILPTCSFSFMPNQLDGAKVLVVDDEPLVRRLTRRILEEAGHRVYEAANGLEAVSAFNEHAPFDLVVSDIRMPTMDGQELSTFLRRLTPPIPIILMSAFDEMVPGRLVLQKPFHPDQLMARVREVLEEDPSKKA
jgi:CheY-like chemotaxis protein